MAAKPTNVASTSRKASVKSKNKGNLRFIKS